MYVHLTSRCGTSALTPYHTMHQRERERGAFSTDCATTSRDIPTIPMARVPRGDESPTPRRVVETVADTVGAGIEAPTTPTHSSSGNGHVRTVSEPPQESPDHKRERVYLEREKEREREKAKEEAASKESKGDPGVVSLADQRAAFYSMLRTPFALSSTVTFGMLMCFDCVLYWFTVFPLRCLVSVLSFLTGHPVTPGVIADASRLVMLSGAMLLLVTKFSLAFCYHWVKQQSYIKLYTLYSMVDLVDTPVSALGVDLGAALLVSAAELSCALSPSTPATQSDEDDTSSDVPSMSVCAIPPSKAQKRRARTARYKRQAKAWLGLLIDVVFGTIHTVLHTMLLVVQLMTLFMTVSSNDYSLVTLMVSVKFKEIKKIIISRVHPKALFTTTLQDIYQRVVTIIILSLVVIKTTNLEGWVAPIPKSLRRLCSKVLPGSEGQSSLSESRATVTM
ncbi:membrane protein,Tapt1/CMV receptor, partial [Kipferlia bialata]|eukprot:g6568.t1